MALKEHRVIQEAMTVVCQTDICEETLAAGKYKFKIPVRFQSTYCQKLLLKGQTTRNYKMQTQKMKTNETILLEM